MSNLDLAVNIQQKLESLFIYVHDSKQYMMNEHWTSHADTVDRGERFKDDCDGYACTAAELLVRAGVPKEDILLVYCQTETGENHLVCGVHVDDSTYILENRYEYVYPWTSKTRYKWFYYMYLSAPGKWDKVTNA